MRTKVFEATFAAATYMDLRRLPELYCGFRRRRGAGPTLYPVACSPQAWASGSLFMMIQAALGIEFDPAARTIRFRNPRLPESFDQVVLRGLGVGDATVDVELRRSRRPRLDARCAKQGRRPGFDGRDGIGRPARANQMRLDHSGRFGGAGRRHPPRRSEQLPEALQ